MVVILEFVIVKLGYSNVVLHIYCSKLWLYCFIAYYLRLSSLIATNSMAFVRYLLQS